MIEWRDTLLTTSEIAITIAGFAGLVGMLARRDQITRSSLEYVRLRFMLEYSFFALGYSLLPFLVFAAGFGEAASWRASSTLACAAYVGYFIANRRFLSEFAAFASARERFSASLVDLPATLFLAVNAAVLPFESGALLYVAAVYLHLSGAAVGLFRLVGLVWEDASDARGEE